MPSKSECAKKFPKGSQAYKQCVSYKGGFAKSKPAPKKPSNSGGMGGY